MMSEQRLSDLPLFRSTDPDTSREAAAVVAPRIGKIQHLVLRVYAERGPMSARAIERLPDLEGYGFSTLRKRVSELTQSGHLERCGTDHSGRAPITIWRISLTGRSAL